MDSTLTSFRCWQYGLRTSLMFKGQPTLRPSFTWLQAKLANTLG